MPCHSHGAVVDPTVLPGRAMINVPQWYIESEERVGDWQVGWVNGWVTLDRQWMEFLCLSSPFAAISA